MMKFPYWHFVALALALGSAVHSFAADMSPIDREALVKRHNPTARKLDPLSPFSVGNGEFAFTADITGLQTFPDAYNSGIALHTESQWGWHSAPNPDGYKLADATRNYKFDGREVPYADLQDSPAGKWLRANPHRIDLGRLGLILRGPDGEQLGPDKIEEPTQTLDLWTGVLDSRFKVNGAPVHVRTACHPERDLIAVEIESPLLSSGNLGVSVAFPGAIGDWIENADWEHPEAHQTATRKWPGRCDFTRTLDATKVFARLEWSEGADFSETGPHRYQVLAKGSERLSVVCAFSQEPVAGPLPTAATTFKASAMHWEKFWRSGGAIDLSGSTDPRAKELERRIVLSQYLTAINCSGSMPPQETGLVRNSWFGKFHLEMHWWHAAHFALWGREALMERSLGWYRKILPAAQAHAREQGFAGARWPKMVGPDGIDSPSQVAAFLIWQQPHPLYFAELLYRANPNEETLKKYSDIVFQTAEFMASFARWDEETKRYVLGPVIIPAQETYGKWRTTTVNPTYELAYWHWALETAQQWRTRLGMKREPQWDKVLTHLSKPTVRDGVYAAIESEPYTIPEDHPSMLAALGVLPKTPLIDPATMSKTLDAVLKTWDWPSTWGWDYPMMAMTAARVGRADIAIDALLMDAPKNVYLPNGHNYQDKRLPLYLPGNGGLLAAIAMMAAGWDDAPTNDAPGFPKDGKWNVRSEGLRPMP